MVVKEPLVILLPWTVSWVAKISLSYTHTHIHMYVHTWYVVGSIIRCSRRFLATKDWLIYSFFLKFEDNFLDVKKKNPEHASCKCQQLHGRRWRCKVGRMNEKEKNPKLSELSKHENRPQDRLAVSWWGGELHTKWAQNVRKAIERKRRKVMLFQVFQRSRQLMKCTSMAYKRLKIYC